MKILILWATILGFTAFLWDKDTHEPKDKISYTDLQPEFK